MQLQLNSNYCQYSLCDCAKSLEIVREAGRYQFWWQRLLRIVGTEVFVRRLVSDPQEYIGLASQAGNVLLSALTFRLISAIELCSLEDQVPPNFEEPVKLFYDGSVVVSLCVGDIS